MTDQGNDDGSETEPGLVDTEVLNAVEFYKRRGIPWVDVSKRDLLTLPPAILNFNTVQYLNVNSNRICSLPESFFEAFPLLTWFDIRFNQLTFLPSLGLSSHGRLQTLLLQGNKITTLPLELGLVKPLGDIQFHQNPLEFPSKEVLSHGTIVIKDFLAAVLQTHGRIPDGTNNDAATLNDIATIGNKGDEFSSTSRAQSSTVSKLHQRRLPSSISTNERMKLKQPKIGSSELPTTETLLVKAKEQSSRDAQKKKLIKIDKILQKRRDDQTLDDWRDKAKEMQRLRDLEKRYNGGYLDFDEPAKMAPFGVNSSAMRVTSDLERRRALSPKSRPKPLSPDEIERREKMQDDKDGELTNMIKEHMTRVVSRTRVQRKDSVDTNTAQQDLSVAKEELEMAQRLQQEVSRRRKEMEFRMKVLQTKIAAKAATPTTRHYQNEQKTN